MKHYTADDICPVVISYNPDNTIKNNVAALLAQAGRCVIVDNGSTKAEHLAEIENRESVHLIRLGENKGIAAALNVGLKYCADHSYPLMLTMDQDTVLETGAMEELLRCMEDENADSVGINWDGKAQKNESVSFLITSGNLVKTEAAQKVSGFDEALFIDSVDFDFSLKLKEYGYKLVKAAKAGAVHHLGEQQTDGYTTHSVERYYYIYRNHFYLIRKYRKTQRAFCIKKQLALGYDLFRILLFDKQKKAKFRMLVRGYRDSRKL